jgi:hypothetical protein
VSPVATPRASPTTDKQLAKLQDEGNKALEKIEALQVSAMWSGVVGSRESDISGKLQRAEKLRIELSDKGGDVDLVAKLDAACEMLSDTVHMLTQLNDVNLLTSTYITDEREVERLTVLFNALTMDNLASSFTIMADGLMKDPVLFDKQQMASLLVFVLFGCNIFRVANLVVKVRCF